MEATQTQSTEQSLLRHDKFVLLFGQLFGGGDYPNPDENLPPGPWDPYIRRALSELRAKLERQRLFPHEEAWRAIATIAALSGREEIWDAVIPHSHAALNPQPLPPRAVLLAAVAQQFIDRTLLIQETADVINDGERAGIIVIGGRLERFVSEVDELCPRLPKKFPKPKGGRDDRFSALELIAAGAVFFRNAELAAGGELRGELNRAGGRLLEEGMARL